MQIKLRPIGNSDAAEAEMTIERNALPVRRIATARRLGWAEAAERIAAGGDDTLVLGDFASPRNNEEPSRAFPD
jgi:hypothetical protein